MPDKDTFDELSLLVRARYALYAWSRSRSTIRGSHFTDPLVDKTAEPDKALAFIREQGAGLFVFRDLAAHWDEPAVISSILDGVDYFNTRKGAIIVVGRRRSCRGLTSWRRRSRRVPAD